VAIYTFKLFTPDGRYVTELSPIISAEIGRTKNDVGATSLLLPALLYSPDIFVKDAILEVWRHTPTKSHLVGDTCWFLRKIQFKLREGRYSTVELVFYDTLDLLRRRVNAWFLYEREELTPGVYNRVRQYPTNLYQNAHDTLVDLFTHNYSTAYTDETRWAPDLSGNKPAQVLSGSIRAMPIGYPALKGDAVAASPIVMIDSAWEKVLDAMQKTAKAAIVQGGNLWFDILYTPSQSLAFGTLNFMVWETQKGARNSFTLSPYTGSLTNVVLSFDYTDTATVVYAVTPDDILYSNGGIKPFPLKNVGVIEKHTDDYDISPFYPIESSVVLGNSSTYVDTTASSANNNALDVELLAQLAYEELYNKKQRKALVGDIVQLPTARLFEDYDYGDIVIAEVFGTQFEAEIDSFVITVSESGKEEIKIPLRADYNDTRAIN
jgi:hypothetical protein